GPPKTPSWWQQDDFTSHKHLLQRLKRSLSFKSVIRSKSVDNFFQRSNGESRPPSCLTATSPPPLGSPPPFSDPSLSGTSKTQPKSQAQPVQLVKTHCFQEHVFRRPTSCQRCKHTIQGNSKQGLRCKSCKMATHLWCSSELSQQPCNGKVSRLQIKLSGSLHNNIVDPVYEALRYGMTLAQMSQSSIGSISESPSHRRHGGTMGNTVASQQEGLGVSVWRFCMEEHTPKRVEVHSIHTYVALYKFLPQEKNDLELQPGDRIQVTDDSNEDWWKGKSRNKVGFFPANFVQRIRPGERVWKVTTGFHGNRDKGQMTVKESQICIGKNEEIDGFFRLSSGKKRGLVPVKCLLEI
uniref:SH3 and cysteine-rich domain-containing protein 2 n=1 Tax=Amphilophus citrinellus TaxID=61819 RepID=A0A3Q0TBT4_AMPCI